MMIERTKGPVTIMADHSKWGLVSNFEVARFNHFQQFISDSGLSEQNQGTLTEYSIEVLIAS